MLNGARVANHEMAAQREESAAARTPCEVSARIHRELAEMHRREAARAVSVQQALQVAFGD